MKIYTKTGDDGTTGLYGGERVKKTSSRVVAYGTVDEVNAAVGVVRAAGLSPFVNETLEHVQADLFVLGAELACVPGKEGKLPMKLLGPPDAARLESAIDHAEQTLPPLQTFILPAGSPQAAMLHLARTIARRAERAVLDIDDVPTRPDIIVYLNRLSDLLFVLARFVNHEANISDTPWAPRSDSAASKS